MGPKMTQGESCETATICWKKKKEKEEKEGKAREAAASSKARGRHLCCPPFLVEGSLNL